MDNSKPISIQNVQGNVTVTIVEGNNNTTELSIDAFIKRFAQDCGLRLIYIDDYKEDNNTSTNFQDWLKGFSFNIKSIYHGREFRRENLLKDIKIELEDKQRLLLLGESGTSKSVILMEILCDYLKNGYKILHNLESGSMESSSSEIKNLEFIEDTLLALVESREKILIVVDNVHNKTISNIFYVIKKIRDDNEEKLDKIRFLLSARQPEFGWAMESIFDSETIERIDILFDEERRLFDIDIDKEKKSKLYFTEDEVKGFIKKYKDYLHQSKRNKTIEENAQEIYKDTQGHPIMVRFSVLQNGLKYHVIQMYQDHLLTDNSPNIERIKSVIACSLYDISSIPLTEDELYNKLGLKKSSLQIINTMIKRTGTVWTTIHPKWDLELFKHLFSLNEADREEIQGTFGYVLNRILEIQRGSLNQLTILNSVYNTIAAEQFINIKYIQEMIKVDDIEDKIDDPFFKVLFFATIIGVTFAKLKNHEYAIVYYDKAIEINPQYAYAYLNKGATLSALDRNEEAIVCYNRAIEINPQHALAYYNKGLALSTLGRYDEAIDSYDKAIEINPQHALAYYNKGIALSAIGRMEEAIVWYDKDIEINPLYADAYLNKGNALSTLGKNDEAIDSYDKGIEINPQYALAYYNKGIALSAIGKNDEAIDIYDNAIEINPQHAGAYNNKGLALSTLGRYEEAIDSYDNAIEINPQHAGAYNNKGLALSTLGRYEEAIDIYDNAIEINPQLPNAYYNKGLTLSTLGRYEEALDYFSTVLEYDQENLYSLLGKAYSLIQLNRKVEAKSLIDEILFLYPDNESALELKKDD